MPLPKLRGVELKVVIKHYLRDLNDDAVTDTAAQLSYYFLFSLFPFLVFLVTMAAFLPIQDAVDSVLDRLKYVMPSSAMDLLTEHLGDLVHQTRPKLLTVGLLVTLWSASRAVDAMRKGLNRAYDVPESRPYWKTQLVALGTTVLGSGLILLSFSMFLLGGELGLWLADKADVGRQFAVVWGWLRWPFTALVVMFSAAVCYWVLPDVKQKFKYITPGSVTATVAWLVSTYGFTEYVQHFGKFNITYGSLGGAVVLLMWLYITGLVFLIGGELNATLEHLAPDGKVKGARAEGEPPLPPEVRPSAAPAGMAKSKKSAERAKKRSLWLHWRRRGPLKPQET